MSELEVAITTQHLPDGTPARVLTWLKEFQDLGVTIAANEMRTAEVTLSIYDPAARFVVPYRYMLYVLLYGTPIFWGQLHGPEWRPDSREVIVHATDPGLRLEHHFIVAGDGIVETTGPFSGKLPVDSRGFRLLRDAAENIPSADSRNVPVLGIGDGLADTTSTVRAAVQHGDEVWSSMTSLAENAVGPDFMLTPVPIAASWPDYVKLDCWDNIGVDRSDQIRFEYGFGKDNIEEASWTPGGKFVTHSHVADADSKITLTSAALAESAQNGIFVDWEATNYKIKDADSAILQAKADAIIGAYRHPVEVVQATLRNEIRQAYRFLKDYFVGDVVTLEGKLGFMYFQGRFWIQSTTVKQADRLRTVQTEHAFVTDLGTFTPSTEQ